MEPRIGVYVCRCGINIAGKVDVATVAGYAKNLDCVIVTREYDFMCSQLGQQLIKDDICELDLNRIVIASCSPTMHEATFRSVCQNAGVNPYLMEIANIREQCSWVTEDPAQATAKAIDLVVAAVRRITYHQPLQNRQVPVNPATLVVGGGIAGIQAAIKIANSGHQVYLVERSSSIGGRMAQRDKTFPTLDCSACVLSPRMAQVSNHPLIRLMVYSEVEEVSGYIGNFNIKVRSRARYVDEAKCTSCGLCVEKCPVKVPNEFNDGLDTRKAIYIPFPQAVPNTPVIDKVNCTYFKNGKCRACEKFCAPEAIVFDQQDEISEIEVGAVIIATGYDLFDPSIITHYGYRRYDNVFTANEFERMVGSTGPTNGRILMRSDQPPQSVAIVHCVGSRDRNYHEYCSRVCCMNALKFAHQVRTNLPEANIYNFYIDIRSFGKGYEEFYKRVADEGVKFIRGKVAQITDQAISDEEQGKLVIIADDTTIGRPVRIPVDMVVLCTALIPRADATQVARTFNISHSPDGFFREKHPKLDPVATTTDGIFIAGCAQSPKDIPDTVAQAAAAAAEVLALLSQPNIELEATNVAIDARICSGCQYCQVICPYTAISLDANKGVCVVNEVLCKGCGACMVSCNAGAITLNHFGYQQILAQSEGLWERLS